MGPGTILVAAVAFGVIVLISKNPRQLEVTAGRKTSMVFNYAHRQKVVEILKKGLGKTPDLVVNGVAESESLVAEVTDQLGFEIFIR